MTDTETNFSPVPEPDAPAAVMVTQREPVLPPPPAGNPGKSGGGWGWRLFGVLACLLLAGGEGYLWQQQQMLRQGQAAVAAPSGAAPSGGVAPQLSALQNQVAELQEQVAKAQPAPDAISVQADLSAKTAELGAQVAALQTEFATDHAAVTTLAASGASLQKTAARIEILGALAGARMALDSGQPVGAIPGAPTALAAFASEPPPTMAELILTYPQAEDAANAASAEKAAKSSFWQRVLARLSGLVTISNGDRVILGAPAAAITAQAGMQLDAGDLAGAVNTLTSNLSPSTLDALGPWLGQAKALLAARAAIAQMSQS